MRLPISVGLFLFSSISLAAVDMKNGKYSDTWIDVLIPHHSYDLRLERTYNSQSNYTGMFGYGWCTDFENKVEKTSNNTLTIKHCDIEPDSIFLSKKESKDKNTFYKKNNPLETLTISGNEYLHASVEGSIEKFNAEGKLVSITDKNGNVINFIHSKGRLREINNNLGQKLIFKTDSSGKVTWVMASNGTKLQYQYDKQGNLLSSQNAWGNNYSYQYDNKHHLTRVTYPDRTKKELTYDPKTAKVIAVRDRKNCLEKFQTQTAKEDGANHFWTTTTKTCEGKIDSTGRYEYWFKKNSLGEQVLERLYVKLDKDQMETIYHELWNQPIVLRKDKIVTTFEYDNNGLLISKNQPDSVWNYTYDPKSNRITDITILYLDDQGKERDSLKINFKYDNKGNVVQTGNSHGKQISLTYDSMGRISEFKDQALRILKITYEPKFGKPETTSIEGVGTLKYIYDEWGNLKTTESAQGPEVVKSIASTLNEYLDILDLSSTPRVAPEKEESNQ